MQDFLWFTKVHGPQFNLTVTYLCICTNDYNAPYYDSYPATGVLSMGGNFVAAAVPRSFPDVVFMHSADSPQDAAGRLPSTGSLIVLWVNYGGCDHMSSVWNILGNIIWCFFYQGALGTQDLGQVYFEPIKDKHGNALLVLLKDMNASPNLDGVRWMQLCKLQLQRKSISSPEEPTALDMLLITLHVSPAGLKILLCNCNM